MATPSHPCLDPNHQTHTHCPQHHPAHDTYPCCPPPGPPAAPCCPSAQALTLQQQDGQCPLSPPCIILSHTHSLSASTTHRPPPQPCTTPSHHRTLPRPRLAPRPARDPLPSAPRLAAAATVTLAVRRRCRPRAGHPRCVGCANSRRGSVARRYRYLCVRGEACVPGRLDKPI